MVYAGRPQVKNVTAHVTDETLERLLAGRVSSWQKHQLDLHLDECEACRRLVSDLFRDGDGVSHPSETSGQPPHGPLTLPGVGDRIHRYTLLSQLGRGGMGQVFEAYDTRLDRNVAIKLLHSGALGDTRRLMREGRALAQLSHPNVVTIFDVDTAEGRPYIVMECIEGVDLAGWVRRARPTAREIVRACVHAGRGVVAAHAAGIIHCDLKPSNILRTPEGRVAVVDFGLFQLCGGPEPVAGGRRGGTPGFMAPETQLDERADQYGLCATIVALLCRRPLSSRDSSELVSAAPSGLRKILCRGLAVDPKQRFGTMADLVDKLERWTRPAWRRAPAVMAATMCMGVVATMAVVHRSGCPDPAVLSGTLWEQRRPEMRTALAALGPRGAETFARIDPALTARAGSWAAAQSTVCLGRQGTMQGSDRVFATSACLGARRRELEQFVDSVIDGDATVLDRAVETLEGLQGVDECLAIAQAQNELAPSSLDVRESIVRTTEELAGIGVLVELGRYNTAEQKLTELVEAVGDMPSEALAVRLALVQHDLLDAQGEYRQAAEVGQRAAHLAQLLDDPVLMVQSKERLVYLWGVRLKQPDKAAAVLLFARADAERLDAASRDAMSLQLALDQAAIFRLGLALDDALSELDRAALLIEDEGSISWGRLLDQRGDLLVRMGRNQEALAAFASAESTLVQALGAHHPRVAFVRVNRATTLIEQGDEQEAQRLLVAAQRDLSVALGPNHVALSTVWLNLGVLQENMGHLDDAVDAYQRAVDVRELNDGVDAASLILPLGHLANLLITQKRYSDADPVAQRLRALAQTHAGPHRQHVAQAELVLARLAGAVGDAAVARQHLDSGARVVADAPEQLWLEDMNLRITAGDLSIGAGQHRAAVAAYGQARALLERHNSEDPFLVVIDELQRKARAANTAAQKSRQ